MENKQDLVQVDRFAIIRLLEVAVDRWISNPELVIDAVRRFAGETIPDHPLIKAKTLRAEKEAHRRFIVVDLDSKNNLQKENEYRYRAMCYFARLIDNYSHIGKPNVIGDIIGFWDVAREQAGQDSGFAVPMMDLFHDWRAQNY